MKYLTFITLFFTYFLSNFSDKPVVFTPPGTSIIVDNFFMDQGEIQNSDWKNYLSDLKNKHGENSEIYLAALPDTTVWRTEKSNNNPFVVTYFQHPSFDHYPVVGISHKQAKEYCIWRTQTVKEMMKAIGDDPVNFEYRLPTQTEWELVANAGYSKKQKKLLNKKNKKYNGKTRIYNMKFDQNTTKKSSVMTFPSLSFIPNKYNIYHIYGNVAEMVAEQNIAVGGSLLDKYEDIVPSNKVLKYEGPQMWLGFRCVAEIIE